MSQGKSREGRDPAGFHAQLSGWPSEQPAPDGRPAWHSERKRRDSNPHSHFWPRPFSRRVACQFTHASSDPPDVDTWRSVGMVGFEPTLSCSQSRRDDLATLHPEALPIQRKADSGACTRNRRCPAYEADEPLLLHPRTKLDTQWAQTQRLSHAPARSTFQPTRSQ